MTPDDFDGGLLPAEEGQPQSVTPLEPVATVHARLPGPGLLAAVGWLVVLLVVQLVLGVAGALAAVVAGVEASLPLIAIAVTGNLVTAALIVGIKYGPSGREKLAFRSPGAMRLIYVFLMALPLLLVIGEASSWLADACRKIGVPNQLIEIWGYNDTIEVIGKMNPLMGTVSVIIFGALFPAIGEELFFRGFIGRGLVARWGRFRGVLLASLLFGAMHIHPFHAVFATVLGLILHALYLWTRSLIAPMLLHAVNNFASLQFQVMANNNQLPLMAKVHLPPVLAVTAVLATAGLGWLLYRSQVRWLRADGTDWSPGFPTAETPPTKVAAQLVAPRIGCLGALVATWLYLLFLATWWLELSR